MNSTQHIASGRPMTIQRRRVQASEERDDSHYSFLQVRKGSVLLTRMESITAYRNKHGSGTQEESDTPVSVMTCVHWMNGHPMLAGTVNNYIMKKKGRGVLKGLKASKKRYANGPLLGL